MSTPPAQGGYRGKPGGFPSLRSDAAPNPKPSAAPHHFPAPAKLNLMDVQVTMQSERTGIENNWYALTGRIADLMVEPDGDLHIALHDATGSKMGIVSCEIPVGPQWCSLRTTVFSWTSTKFPFHTSSTKRLMFTGSLIITVVGKAFWDIGHAPKDRSNHRKYMPEYAACSSDALSGEIAKDGPSLFVTLHRL